MTTFQYAYRNALGAPVNLTFPVNKSMVNTNISQRLQCGSNFLLKNCWTKYFEDAWGDLRGRESGRKSKPWDSVRSARFLHGLPISVRGQLEQQAAEIASRQ